MDYALQNRAEWEERGQELVDELVQEMQMEQGEEGDDGNDEDEREQQATSLVEEALISLEDAEKSQRSSHLQLYESQVSLDHSAKTHMLAEKHTKERKDDEAFIASLETELQSLKVQTPISDAV